MSYIKTYNVLLLKYQFSDPSSTSSTVPVVANPSSSSPAGMINGKLPNRSRVLYNCLDWLWQFSGVTTKTVFGFDEFVTTVGNTVMVFLPSADLTSTSSSSITSRPELTSSPVEKTSVFVTPENLSQIDSDSSNKLPLEKMFSFRYWIWSAALNLIINGFLQSRYQHQPYWGEDRGRSDLSETNIFKRFHTNDSIVGRIN